MQGPVFRARHALYSAFFATIGAMVGGRRHHLLLPAMAPLLFSYMLASASLDSPESTWPLSCSCRSSAPISMMRLPMGVPGGTLP